MNHKYTIVIDAIDSHLVYLIVRLGDIGHYVVAKVYALTDAKIMRNAFEAAEKLPPPF